MEGSSLKQRCLRYASLAGLDRLFRQFNRNRLLVVMYHGISAATPSPPLWTQLPRDRFREQLLFLKRHYQPVTLEQLELSIKQGHPLPQRALLITFDDGLRNNATVAFPLLQQLEIPATIFLTMDRIGYKGLLWFDELFFLLQQAITNRIVPDIGSRQAEELLHVGRLLPAYQVAAEYLKRCGQPLRTSIMAALRKLLPLDRSRLLDDYGLLGWHQVESMHRSGLISFGVHTATHRILTELSTSEWQQEVVQPRRTLENRLQVPVHAFSFPNGRPQDDFRPHHLPALRQAGYLCAFSTESRLFNWQQDEPLAISRIPAGNDATSDPDHFSLATSGALTFLKQSLQRLKNVPGGCHVSPQP